MQLASPDVLGIQDVADVRGRWLAELASAPADTREFKVDLGALPDLDAAGLQLLVSLACTVERRGAKLRLGGARDTLRVSVAEWRSGLATHFEG